MSGERSGAPQPRRPPWRRVLGGWPYAGAALSAVAVLVVGVVSFEFGGRGREDGTTVEVRVPAGATSRQIAEQLKAAGLISYPTLFDGWTRLRGGSRSLKAGRYEVPLGAPYGYLLRALRRGAVATVPLTIPEGLTLDELAERLAAFTGDSAASVRAYLADSVRVAELQVPGPTLEGYLMPETYRFADGVGVPVIVAEMARRYREFWGTDERARAETLGLDEREIVTLASIVEEEVRRGLERPTVAGVYWNRLRRGMPLQADATVQYALDRRRARLLFRDIDSVAAHPYNTYARLGLPPGPIASPGAASLRAALGPAAHDFLYYVARPDGYHEFTRTLREHNAAVARVRSGRLAPVVENP